MPVVVLDREYLASTAGSPGSAPVAPLHGSTCSSAHPSREVEPRQRGWRRLPPMSLVDQADLGLRLATVMTPCGLAPMPLGCLRS